MNRLRGTLPIGLAAVLIFIIAALTPRRLAASSGPAFAIAMTTVVVYVTWLLLEGRVVATRELGRTESSRDHFTMEPYALSRGIIVALALGVASSIEPAATVMAAGLALMTAAIGWRLYAIVTLGPHYSHRVRVVDEHQAITTGPYRLVRHPAYAGMLFAHVGLTLVFFNWWAALSVPALMLPAILRRIVVEERELVAVPGYDQYAASRKRLVPLVW